jgi:hypothetical protein
MTCAEFQEILPDLVDSERSPDQLTHLSSCSACSHLLADLRVIAQEAQHLRGSVEPSPRVWANIELTLRREGVIRDPHPALPVLQGRSAWAAMWRWMLPLTAGFLLTFGVLRNLNHPAHVADNTTAPKPVAPGAAVGPEDQEIMQVVANRSENTQAAYAENLRAVDSYIQDARKVAESNPSDEAAQQVLEDAYQQKAAVYQLAMDRSIP